jgi:hypothetical protein
VKFTVLQTNQFSKKCEILGYIHSCFTENSQFLFTLEKKKTQRNKSSKKCEILGHIHSCFTENSQFLFTLEKPGKKQSIFTVVSQKNHSFCLLWKKQQKTKQFSKKTGKFQFLKIFLHKQNS